MGFFILIWVICLTWWCWTQKNKTYNICARILPIFKKTHTHAHKPTEAHTETHGQGIYARAPAHTHTPHEHKHTHTYTERTFLGNVWLIALLTYIITDLNPYVAWWRMLGGYLSYSIVLSSTLHHCFTWN